MLILTIIVVFGLLFVICEFGERLMNKFEEFNDGLCECQWYFHPIGLQRMYLTFGVETQQPVYIRGYGNVSTTRDTMKKVSLIIHKTVRKKCSERLPFWRCIIHCMFNCSIFNLGDDQRIFIFYDIPRVHSMKNVEEHSIQLWNIK